MTTKEKIESLRRTADAIEAWEKDPSTPIEFHDIRYPENVWCRHNGLYWEVVSYEYRIANTPKAVPWTFETCPVGTVVRYKRGMYKAIISEANRTEVCLGSFSPVSYEKLLTDYEQLDGSPCGTVEKP